jgi:phosphate transport system substrate-binding protein
MKNLLAIFSALTLFLLTTSPRAKGVELLGAGATFPYPLYSKMFYSYWKRTGVKVNYQPIGSGGGQRQLLNKTVDFGGSDAFMSDEALAGAPARILHIPICVGAVVITYNLSGNPELRLTPNLITDIFLGKITRWDDTKIVETNPDAELPGTNITVVHRSDGSGTTFVLTDYLSKVSKDWEGAIGRGKAVNWPVGLGAKGNPGITGLIKLLPGAVGYTELGYVLLNRMPLALVQNRGGAFIRPSPVSTSLAADISLPEDTRASLTNTHAPGGYPISSLTWILVYQEQAYQKRSMEKAKELVRVLWWMIHEGQRYAKPLHYAPLPDQALIKAEKLIKSICYHGKPILQ